MWLEKEYINLSFCSIDIRTLIGIAMPHLFQSEMLHAQGVTIKPPTKQ